MIQIIGYTFPVDSEAAQAQKLVQPASNEICWFAEVSIDDKISINVTYGKFFGGFIKEFKNNNHYAENLEVNHTIFYIIMYNIIV